MRADHRQRALALASSIYSRFPIEPPFCPENLAILLGYEVRWVTLNCLGGAFGSSYRRTIYVARTGHIGRDRWTLIHEVVHLELGLRGTESPEDEALVDRCVAELLLPTATLERDVTGDSGGLDLPALCRRWRVSYEAMARRIVEIVPSCVAIADPARVRLIESPMGTDPGVRHITRQMAIEGTEGRTRHGLWHVGAWLTPGGTRCVSLATPSAV